MLNSGDTNWDATAVMERMHATFGRHKRREWAQSCDTTKQESRLLNKCHNHVVTMRVGLLAECQPESFYTQGIVDER